MNTRPPFIVLVAILVILYALTGCFDTKISPTELAELRTHTDKELTQALVGSWKSDKQTVFIAPGNDGGFNYKIITGKDAYELHATEKEGRGFVATIEGIAIVFLNPTPPPDSDVLNPKALAPRGWGIFAIRLDDTKSFVSGTNLKGLESETSYRAVADYIKTTPIKREFIFSRAQ